MDLRTKLCFELSRRFMAKPAQRTTSYTAYSDWRYESLSGSWHNFSDEWITGRDILDFGCGDGQLSRYLAENKTPSSIVGVDLVPASIERAREHWRQSPRYGSTSVEFRTGAPDRMPVDDRSFDTLVAFDCLEHVMRPQIILSEWYRVLRPGGRCLIEWYPYKGPWGPHMEALIPVPWAHVMFGQHAMFRAAERIYDLPDFIPRHWDLDTNGMKKPNKWRQWSTFKEQGYINELDLSTFKSMARTTGFEIARFERRSFGGSGIRRGVGGLLMRVPLLGEYFTSFVVVELVRPR